MPEPLGAQRIVRGYRGFMLMTREGRGGWPWTAGAQANSFAADATITGHSSAQAVPAKDFAGGNENYAGNSATPAVSGF